MIKKILFLLNLLFLTSCSGVDLVLNEKNEDNNLKNNSLLILNGMNNKVFSKEIYSYFGNNKNGEYILTTTFSEKKERRLVKQNQVAEKVTYILTVKYEVYYKDIYCKIFNKKINSQLSFVPKSFGYNFGADRSFEKLYIRAVRSNIETFSDSIGVNKVCIK